MWPKIVITDILCETIPNLGDCSSTRMFGSEGLADLLDLFKAAEGGNVVEDFLKVVGDGGLLNIIILFRSIMGKRQLKWIGVKSVIKSEFFKHFKLLFRGWENLILLNKYNNK